MPAHDLCIGLLFVLPIMPPNLPWIAYIWVVTCLAEVSEGFCFETYDSPKVELHHWCARLFSCQHIGLWRGQQLLTLYGVVVIMLFCLHHYQLGNLPFSYCFKLDMLCTNWPKRICQVLNQAYACEAPKVFLEWRLGFCLKLVICRIAALTNLAPCFIGKWRPAFFILACRWSQIPASVIKRIF